MIITIKGFCPLNLLDKLLNKLSYERSEFFKNLISFKYNYYNDAEVFYFLNISDKHNLELYIKSIEEKNPNEINIIHTFNNELIKECNQEQVFIFDEKLLKLVNH